METKYNHTTDLTPTNVHPIIELFFEYAQLKNLYRQGWIKHGVSKEHCESDADHSFGVALLSYIIAEEYRPDLNSLKTLRLGLFHELCEITPGDFTPTDNISSEDKFNREYNSIKKTFSKFPNPDKYISLWMEFEKESTPEAVFVKQIDRLEMALQANLYERLKYNNLDDFFPYVKERIKSPELKNILEDIIKTR